MYSTVFPKRLFWLLIAQVFFSCLAARAEVPTEFVVGTDSFRTEESFLLSSATAHRIIRNAVNSPLLTSKPGTNLFTLIFADSFHVDAAGVVWSYRVRNGMVFSNGEPISGSDLCYSLLNCSARTPNSAASFNSCSIREDGIEGAAHQWIDVRFSGLPAGKERQAAVMALLSNCPILEHKSSKIFGSDLAKGSNMLSSGDYQITDFLTDKSVQMQRFQRDKAGRTVNRQTVTVKGFGSMKEALTALRVGTIALFFNTDPEIEKIALQDETLRVANCGVDRVIYRRGFQFICHDVINLASVTWDLVDQPQ